MSIICSVHAVLWNHWKGKYHPYNQHSDLYTMYTYLVQSIMPYETKCNVKTNVLTVKSERSVLPQMKVLPIRVPNTEFVESRRVMRWHTAATLARVCGTSASNGHLVGLSFRFRFHSSLLLMLRVKVMSVLDACPSFLLHSQLAQSEWSSRDYYP